MFTKKDRKIANQQMTIECLKEVINSLEEDLQCLREQAYKTAKKPTTRKIAK